MCTLVCIMLLPNAVAAQINYRIFMEVFRGRMLYEDNEETYTKGGGGLGVLVQVPVDIADKPLFIETGLQWMQRPIRFQTVHYSRNIIDSDFLELPVKIGYSKKFNEKNSLEFAFGAYVNYRLGSSSTETIKNRYELGISPAITFKHRAISLGISYRNPVFYKGYQDDFKNIFNFNIGINFSSINWGAIGNVLSKAGDVMTTASDALQSNSGSLSVDVQPSSSYTDISSPSNNQNTSKGSTSSRTANDKNAKWLTANYQSSKRTYSDYESQLIKMKTYPNTYNDSQRKHIQSKMKEIRNKITSHGGACSQSNMETWKVSWE